MKKNRVKFLVSVAMLSSIAFVLMMLKFPVPPFPAFLKIDFSDITSINWDVNFWTNGWNISRIL